MLARDVMTDDATDMDVFPPAVLGSSLSGVLSCGRIQSDPSDAHGRRGGLLELAVRCAVLAALGSGEVVTDAGACGIGEYIPRTPKTGMQFTRSLLRS